MQESDSKADGADSDESQAGNNYDGDSSYDAEGGDDDALTVALPSPSSCAGVTVAEERDCDVSDSPGSGSGCGGSAAEGGKDGAGDSPCSGGTAAEGVDFSSPLFVAASPASPSTVARPNRPSSEVDEEDALLVLSAPWEFAREMSTDKDPKLKTTAARSIITLNCSSGIVQLMTSIAGRGACAFVASSVS